MLECLKAPSRVNMGHVDFLSGDLSLLDKMLDCLTVPSRDNIGHVDFLSGDLSLPE